MSILNTIAGLFSKKSKNTVSSYPVERNLYESKNVPTSFEVSADTLAERQDANIATAIRLIGDSISSLPFTSDKKEIIDDDIKYSPDPQHAANILIEEPNYYHDGKETILHIIQSLYLAGNSYHAIVRDSGKITLWPIESWKMMPEYDADGYPNGYVYCKMKPEEKHFKLEEILHIRFYNISSIFVGRSFIEPLHIQILESYYAEFYNKNFFKNDATPGNIFLPDEPLFGEQAKEFKKNWDELNKGVDKAHGLFVSTVPGKLQNTSLNHKDIAFLELIKLAREKTLSVIGIPPTIAGVMEFASYANALLEDRAYWQNTLIPVVNLIQRAFNRQVMRPYFDADHEFRFDLSHVQALQDDMLKKAQTEAIYVRANIMTVNEVRHEHNLEDVEWGDEPVAPIGLILPGDTPQADNAGGSSLQNSRQALPVRKFVESPRYKKWKAFDKKVSIYEIKYSKLISKYFTDQKERVLARLREVTVQGNMMSMLYFSSKADQYPNDPNFIFNKKVENEILEDIVTPFVTGAIKDGGQSALMDAGLDMNFNVQNPKVQFIIDGLINRSKKINDTSFDAIKEWLGEAYDGGWSLGQLESKIVSEYGNWSRERAAMIARTEMAGALNGGTNEAYLQGGIEKKEWLSVQDSAVRDAHATADGETTSIDSSFIVGGEFLEYPGDPNGSPENVINCRCTIMPVIE